MATLVSRNEHGFGDHRGKILAKKRSDSRLKDLNSCTDVRAWSLKDEERRLHMLDLIQASTTQGGALGRYVPVEAIIDVLLASKNADIARLERQVNELQNLVDIYNRLDLTEEQRRHVTQMKRQIQAGDQYETSSEGGSRYQNAVDDFESTTTDYEDVTDYLEETSRRTCTASPKAPSTRRAESDSGYEDVDILSGVPSVSSPKEKESLLCRPILSVEELHVRTEELDYDNMDADMLRNVLLDKEQEIAYAKCVALSALEKLETMKAILDTTNVLQKKLKQSELKIAALQSEKIQQARAFTSSKQSQLSAKLSEQLTLLRSNEALSSEEKEEVLQSQADVLTHMSALEEAGEQLRKENSFFRNQLRKQSVLEEEIEIQCRDLEQKLSRSFHEINVLRERSQVLDEVILEKLTLEERLSRLTGVEEQLRVVKKRADEADLLERERNRLLEELQRYRDHYEDLSQDFDALSLAKESTQANIENMNKENTELKNKINEMVTNDCERNSEMINLKAERDALASKLESNEKEYAVLTEAKKALLEELDAMEYEMDKAVNQINFMCDQNDLLKRQTLDLQCINADQEDEINVLISHIEHLSDVAESQQDRVRSAIEKMRIDMAHKDALLASSNERLVEMELYQRDMLVIQDQLKQTIEGLEDEQAVIQASCMPIECKNAFTQCCCEDNHIGEVMAESKKVVEYLLERVQLMCSPNECPMYSLGEKLHPSGNNQQLTKLKEENTNLQVALQNLNNELSQRYEQENEKCCQLEFELQVEIANRVSLENDIKNLKIRLQEQTCQSANSGSEEIVVTVSQQLEEEKDVFNKENKLLRYDIMRLETEVVTMCKDLELLQNTNRKFETKIKDLSVLTGGETVPPEAGDSVQSPIVEEGYVEAGVLLDSLNMRKSQIDLSTKTYKLREISEQLNMQMKLLQNEITFLHTVAPSSEADINRLKSISKKSESQLAELKTEIVLLAEEATICPSDEDVENLKKFIAKLEGDIQIYKEENKHLKEHLGKYMPRKQEGKLSRIEEEVLDTCKDIMDSEVEEEDKTTNEYKVRITNLEKIVGNVKEAVKELQGTIGDIRKDKAERIKKLEDKAKQSTADESKEKAEVDLEALATAESDTKRPLRLEKPKAKRKVDEEVQQDSLGAEEPTCTIECKKKTSKLKLKVAELENLNEEQTGILEILKSQMPEVSDIIKELEISTAELQIDNATLVNLINELDNELQTKKADTEQHVPLSLLVMSQMEGDTLRSKINKLENIIAVNLQEKQNEINNQNSKIEELDGKIAEIQIENRDLQNELLKLQSDSHTMTVELEKVIVKSSLKNIELEKELSLLKSKVKCLGNNIDETDVKLRQARNSSSCNLQDMETRLSCLTEECKNLRKEKGQKVLENATLKNNLKSLEEKIQQLEKENYNIKTEIRSAKENQSEIDIEIINSKREVANLKRKIEHTELENTKLKVENDMLKQTLNKVEMENVAYIKEIDALQKQNNAGASLVSNIMKEKEDLQLIINNYEDEAGKVKQLVGDLKVRADELFNENDSLKSQLTDSQKEIVQIRNELEILNQKDLEAEKENETLKKENVDLKQQITFNAENFIGKLKELEEQIQKLEQENAQFKRDAEIMTEIIKDLEESGNRTDLEKENSALKKELENIKQLLQTQSTDLEQSKDLLQEIEYLKENVTDLNKLNSVLEQRIEKLNLEKENYKEEVESLEEEQRATQKEISDLQEKVKESSVNERLLDQEQKEKKLLNKLNDQLKLQIQELELKVVEIQETDSKKVIFDLKTEISKLKDEKEKQKKNIEEKFTRSLMSIKEQYDRNAEYIRGSHATAVIRLQNEHEEELRDVNKEHEGEVSNLQKLMAELMEDHENLKDSFHAIQEELEMYRTGDDKKHAELIQNMNISFPKKDIGDKSTDTDAVSTVEVEPAEEKPSALSEYDVPQDCEAEDDILSVCTTLADPTNFSEQFCELPSNLDITTCKEIVGTEKLTLLRRIATLEEHLTKKQDQAQEKFFCLQEEIVNEKHRLLEAKKSLTEERKMYNNLIEKVRSKTREVADMEVERDMLRQRSYQNENRVRNLITEVENYRATIKSLEEQLRIEKGAVKHLKNLQEIEKKPRKFSKL